MDGDFQTRNSAVAVTLAHRAGADELSRSRPLLLLWLACVFTALCLAGCASHQYGQLLSSDDKDMVGSHEAGAATWNPLVDSSVAQLLGRCPPVSPPTPFDAPSAEMSYADAAKASAAAAKPGEGESRTPAKMASHSLSGELPELGSEVEEITGTVDPNYPTRLVTGPARVCFIGIENKSAEELVDFKDQLYERIDSQINESGSFRSISRRMIDAALVETRLRPDSLFLPDNRAAFAAALGRQGSPVDYLLYATITTGTTDRNKSTQRDYLLTLEMVNLRTGDYIKESSKIRKGYHKTRAGKWWNFGMFDQADG